jgi:hypothetical protein
MELQTPHEPRFSRVSLEKATGATYTRSGLARFVAHQITDRVAPVARDGVIRVLDPAAGDGALLLALGSALLGAGYTRFELHGVEQDLEAAEDIRRRLTAAFPDVRVVVECRDFLTPDTHHHGGALFPASRPARFDAVIANPPYVRTQVLGAEAAQDLARRFGLRGRVDLYHAFLLAIPEVLAPDGVAGIIVSNRFISTKGGTALRTLLPHRLSLQHLWDLGDTKLFDDAVLPAVVVARGVSQGATADPIACRFSSIYSDPAASFDRSAEDPIAAVSGPAGVVRLPDGRLFRVRHGALDAGEVPGAVWRISEASGDAWLQQVLRATWRTFGQIGKIRVGVKTTADSVFIRKDWDTFADDTRPELLRPLTTHHMGARYRATEPRHRKMILYPHLPDGQGRRVASLDDYPRTAAYLEQHREALASRQYLVDAGRQWYEIWVPQSPALWPAPKLVFRDITDRPMFWIDETGSVINGDCYWMVVDEDRANIGADFLLCLAAAVGNSTFIEHFYDHMFNNKLYAGRRRFISQLSTGL